MQNTISSQTMRITAYQTWTKSQISASFSTKSVEAMVQGGSIVDCGNSANYNPLLHPRMILRSL